MNINSQSRSRDLRRARAVVTGGAGFLGSHVCDKLMAEGFEVVCVDNLLTGRRSNIQYQLSNPRFKFIQADVAEPFEIEGRIGYVLHLASPASPADYQKHAIETLKAGAFGTYNMLELAKQKDSVFLLASTSEVYGDPEVHPQTEDYWGHVNPVGERSMYDEAKRFAEAMAMAYFRQYQVDVRIVRIFNTYGPRMRQDDGRALPNFMPQALRGEPLTVYGDGLQTRSHCYVDDLVEGIYRLLILDAERLNKPLYRVINLGNPEEVTVLELAYKVISATGSKSSIVHAPDKTDDPKRRRPDITRAKELLDWSPRVSLDEGLRKTVPYFRSLVAAGAH